MHRQDPASPLSDGRPSDYRGPQIVDVGPVAALTGLFGDPVRDNPQSDNPAYYNANPPKTGCDTVELDEGE